MKENVVMESQWSSHEELCLNWYASFYMNCIYPHGNVILNVLHTYILKQPQ